jgi:hypothetical protein
VRKYLLEKPKTHFRNDQKIILDVDETDRLYAEYLDLLSELGLNLLSWTEKVLGLQPGRLINQYAKKFKFI